MAGLQRAFTPSRVAVVALSWLAAVVLAGSVAWRAVAVVDPDAPASGVLSADQVEAELAAARATSPADPTGSPTLSPSPTTSPTPSPTTGPTSTPEPSEPADPGAGAPVEPVVRTWAVTGGTVAASCSADAISLLYATPTDGWTVEVEAAGPGQVVVELSSGERRTDVSAACVAGVPQPVVTERTDSEDSEGSEGSEQPEHDEDGE